MKKGFREPNEYEIQAAKMLRSVSIRESLPVNVNFFSECYFDIMDNGINLEISKRIVANLLRYKFHFADAEDICSKIEKSRPTYRPSKANGMSTVYLNIFKRHGEAVDLSGIDKFGKEEVMIVLKACADHFGVTVADLLTKSRNKLEINYPRYIASKLCKGKIPLKKMGSIMAGRDHSTMINGIRKINMIMSENERLRSDYKMIKAKLNL